MYHWAWDGRPEGVRVRDAGRRDGRRRVGARAETPLRLMLMRGVCVAVANADRGVCGAMVSSQQS